MEPQHHHVDLVSLVCPECGSNLNDLNFIRAFADFFIFFGHCKNNHSFNLMLKKNETTYSLYFSFWDKQIDYKEYINSPEWKQRALEAKEKAGWKCQVCNKDGNKTTLHAHHRTYENLGDEKDGDIIVLCAKCHAKFHDKECL